MAACISRLEAAGSVGYIVSYIGDESTDPALQKATDNPKRNLRRELEKFHGNPDPAAIDLAWNNLDHEDRFIRVTARTVLEHQPLDRWQERALAETNPVKKTVAILALHVQLGHVRSIESRNHLPLM